MAFKISLIFLIPWLLTACSYFQKQQGVSTNFPPLQSAENIHGYSREIIASKGNDMVDVNLGPVPIEVNKEVLGWVKYFQNRGRPHMEKYLSRSTRYMSLMQQILRQEGMPEDLIYIALIESGFNSRAHSRASAVGYWQFIRATGRRYGLKINYYIDERRDPFASTRAAANYFKSLYNLFGNWYLAMASYNAGENRIKHAVMKYQTRDFWYLARNKKLPRETMHYVPKFLAASMIAKNPERYGFKDVDYGSELEFDAVMISHGISLRKLAREMNIPLQTLKDLNPAVKTDYLPLYRTGFDFVRVPKTLRVKAIASLPKAKTKLRYISSSFTYKVSHGDTLSGLARRFGTTVSQLKRLNKISSNNFIRLGQKLKIPEKGGARKRKNITKRDNKYSYYRVRRGDTLSEIAKKHGLSVSHLTRLNKISLRSYLKVGQSLKLYKKQKRHRKKNHAP